MKREMHILAVLGIVAALVLAACGGVNTPVTGHTATPTSATITAHATLKHMPNGTAELIWDPSSKTLTVQFSLIGLIPNSIHPTQIDAGSCSNEGRVLYPLQDILADEMGNASVISAVTDVTSGIPAMGWNVSIHNGPRMTSADQALTISCGDVSNTSSVHTVRVNMDTAPDKDQSANGTVLLTLSRAELRVKLTMSGLEPNSVHPAHIHDGSCLSQRNIVHRLPNVVADALGNASMTTVLENISYIPSSGWYVNVHYSTNLTTQTGQDPLVCGDIILG